MSAIIYRITNTVNNKIYIGYTTKTLDERWNKHLSKATVEKLDTYFYKAIRKYGKDAWTLETIIHSNDIDFIKEMEKFCIAEYDSANPEKGYNSTLGGEGVIPNEATRQKISESQRGDKNHMWGKKGDKNPMWGKKHSPETLQKMSQAHARRILFMARNTPETLQKMSESQRGDKNPMWGKKHSPETLQKMSESRKRYLQQKNIKNNAEGKSI